MLNKWLPTKKKIKKWINHKHHQFIAQENNNLFQSKEEWLNRYLYTHEHGIFFCTFPYELNWWLSKLVGN